MELLTYAKRGKGSTVGGGSGQVAISNTRVSDPRSVSTLQDPRAQADRTRLEVGDFK